MIVNVNSHIPILQSSILIYILNLTSIYKVLINYNLMAILGRKSRGRPKKNLLGHSSVIIG